VLVFGLPFCVKFIAQGAYQKVDVTLLALLADNREVGLVRRRGHPGQHRADDVPADHLGPYADASRALSRSEEELYASGRRSLETWSRSRCGVPGAGLGADLWIRVAFGADYAPAAQALALLAAAYFATYVNVICSLTLTLLSRGWALTGVALAAMALNAAANVALVPTTLRHFGAGGGGLGCALSMLLTEVCSGVALLWLVGRRSIDGVRCAFSAPRLGLPPAWWR